ncbi:hypothetical protein SS50377_27675 [Spironucleus salmonicida]|uniref:BPI-like protein n=1 Tax=Spironucleus salmonicida TaxID=348837 RepID=V6M092_9EUKA|nr:hypothetical protein SS50377_27675 [Spironucleus salmonicida]|eukprot:EST46549.1 Hypothetical protein SS50377_13353 [Spironucleus salmonicida]
MLVALTLSTQIFTGQKLTITQRGVLNFGENVLKAAPDIIAQLNIKDIEQVVDLGITKVKAKFSDIKLLDLQYETFDVNLEQQILILNNANLNGQLTYELNQLSFPYLRIQGRAIVDATMDIVLNVKIQVDESKKLTFDVISIKINIKQLNADFQNAFVNGVFRQFKPILTKIVQDFILPQLFNILTNNFKLFLEQVQNQQIISGDCIFDYRFNSILFDQRYLTFQFPGFCNQQIETSFIPDNYTNDDINMIISKQVFESVIRNSFDIRIGNGIILQKDEFKTLCKIQIKHVLDMKFGTSKLILECDKTHPLINQYNNNAIQIFNIINASYDNIIYQPDYIIIVQTIN